MERGTAAVLGGLQAQERYPLVAPTSPGGATALISEYSGDGREFSTMRTAAGQGDVKGGVQADEGDHLTDAEDEVSIPTSLVPASFSPSLSSSLPFLLFPFCAAQLSHLSRVVCR
jgi:hypothetical protein